LSIENQKLILKKILFSINLSTSFSPFPSKINPLKSKTHLKRKTKKKLITAKEDENLR